MAVNYIGKFWIAAVVEAAVDAGTYGKGSG